VQEQNDRAISKSNFEFTRMTYDFKTGKTIGIYQALSQIQIDSINAIMDEISAQGITNKKQAAYILATAWHESRLQPIVEWGGKSYLESRQYYPYYGRGFVQLTWIDNYKAQGDRLGIDMVNNPDKALEPTYAANILIYGMKNGSFTGKKLSDYITSAKTDFPNARKIINPADKGTYALVAGYASSFLKCVV
jgi:predicted chitinase